MAPNTNLPPVGKKIILDAIGEVLCHSAGNGRITFLARTDDETITQYQIDASNIRSLGEKYSHVGSVEKREAVYGVNGHYSQFNRVLRSAGL